MTHSPPSVRALGPATVVTVGDPAVLSLRELTRRIGRRRTLILSVAAVTFAVFATYTFVATPRYRSEARLRIEAENSGALMMSAIVDQTSSGTPGAAGAAGAASAAGGGGSGGAGGLGSLLGLGREELETEIAILNSDRVADAAVDSLALSVRLISPNVSRSALLSARVVAPEVDADGKLTLTRQAGGRYRVEHSDFDDTPSVPTIMIPGTPVQIGGIVIMLLPRLATAGPEKIVLRILPRYKVHKLLKTRLSIERQEGGSRLIEVQFDDPDRQLAAEFVSVLIREYVSYSTSMTRTEDTTTVAQLRLQVDSTARRLTEAERTLRTFEERSRLIMPEDQATAQIERVSAISTKVDALSTERNALARMLELIRQRSQGGSDVSAYRQLATFPSLITNGSIQDMLRTLGDLENRRAELGVRRTEANVEYKVLTDRITAIEQQLFSTGSQYLESLDQQLAMTVRTVSALGDTLNAMPNAAMQYARLVRDRTLLETIYIALQKQLKQAELRDVLRQERVKIVDVPRVANVDNPAFPKKEVMLPVGAILALALALTVALFAELWREPVVTVAAVTPMNPAVE